MAQPIVVRRLLAPDVDSYRTIRLDALATAPDAFGSVHGVEASRPTADFVERLASSIVFGAFCEGRIVGLIGFGRPDGPKEAHKGFVWGFYVEPGSRRQGVGGLLFDALIDAARDQVEQLTLTVVRQNTGALALYEKRGFVAYGIEPRSLKDHTGYSDEVLMALRLRPADRGAADPVGRTDPWP